MTPKVKNSISKSGNGYTGDTLHDGNRYMCPICSEEIYGFCWTKDGMPVEVYRCISHGDVPPVVLVETPEGRNENR